MNFRNERQALFALIDQLEDDDHRGWHKPSPQPRRSRKQPIRALAPLIDLVWMSALVSTVLWWLT